MQRWLQPLARNDNVQVRGICACSAELRCRAENALKLPDDKGEGAPTVLARIVVGITL